ncbi:MAG: hypothetical protein BWY68_00751 [bacterium ADurb.Bin400]|nr:MAG: hypothetical protein BWY68_00751 [bacterium ADurb.Bin400]
MFIYYYGVALAATLFLIIIIFGLLQIPLPVIVEVRFRPLLWVILIALPFYIVHLVAYLLNFENKREYERVPASRQATRAFVRFSLVMVVTIIGSLISRALGMRILLLGIIILKTLIDIAAYLNENGKLGKNGQI